MKKPWIIAAAAGAVVLIFVCGLILVKRNSQASTAAGTPRPEGSAPAILPKESESSQARLFFAQAERARISGSLPEAKQLYQQILQQTSSSDLAMSAQNKLGEVNIRLLFSSVQTPDSLLYVVQPGDYLAKIAKQFHTTVDLLKTANGLLSDKIRLGQRLKVSKAVFSVIVNKSQNTLILKNGEEVLKVYRCSTGKGGITPVGNFRIVNRIVNPPWYTNEGVIPSGDPRNQLGSRWLGFDQAGY